MKKIHRPSKNKTKNRKVWNFKNTFRFCYCWKKFFFGGDCPVGLIQTNGQSWITERSDQSIAWLTNRLSDSLIGFHWLLINWLVDHWILGWSFINWQTNWLACHAWLTNWFPAWPTRWPVDWLSDFSADWLTVRMTHWLIHWLSDSPAGWLTYGRTDWLPGWLVILCGRSSPKTLKFTLCWLRR